MSPKTQKLKVGDEVLIEQAWEDQAGHYHDVHATIARIILPEGLLRFRIGHWKMRNQREQKLQAYLNKFEWFESDVQKL